MSNSFSASLICYVYKVPRKSDWILIKIINSKKVFLRKVLILFVHMISELSISLQVLT